MNIRFAQQAQPARWQRRVVALAVIAALALAALPAPARAQGDPPASARLDGLRHIFQTWNNCGPANLTMAMSYFGWIADQSSAAAWLKPDPEDKNVSPGQMAYYVNEVSGLEGVHAFWRYGGTLELLKKFVAAGFPVLVESGFDVDDLGWMGHYQTVVAYDDPSETLWVYDSYEGLGSGYGIEHSYTEFDSWWRHFNRTFLVLFSEDREDDIRDVLGAYVDVEYAAEAALAQARQEAAQDATDPWAWFNAGTSATKLGRYHDAAIYFDEAFRLGLPYRLTWYMFGPYEAYYNVGRYEDVLAMADNTTATTVYVEETNYWRGMAYAALGRPEDAVFQFNEALAFNRNFTPAQTAKDLVESGEFVAPAAPVTS
jgi:tetratricopeptide (TPR) repeat protein